MSFERESKFGVIRKEPKSLKLYYSQSNYIILNVGNEVIDARWVGNELIVYLLNGRTRKYKSQGSYINIT